jgi:hypothetical protein
MPSSLPVIKEGYERLNTYCVELLKPSPSGLSLFSSSNFKSSGILSLTGVIALDLLERASSP